MEAIFQELGICGKFQIILVALIQACRFAAVWALSMMVFGLYNPGWRCSAKHIKPTHLLSVTSNRTKRYLYLNSYANIKSFHESGSSEKPNYNATCSSRCDGIEFDPSSSTVVTQFGLICDDAWKGKLIVTVLNCGMLIGAFVWGQIGERFGRKVSLYLGNFIMAFSSGAAVLSVYFNWQVYAAFTFFIGFGGVGVVPTVNVLSMEFLTSKWRSRVSAFPVWNAGFIGFGLACFLLRDWKYVHLASACLSSLTLFGIFWTPDSIRWLTVHGQLSKAEIVIQRISKLNNKPLSPKTLRKLFDESSNKNSQNYTYIDLFRKRELCLLTIRLCGLWSIASVTYEIIGYGIQSLPGNFYMNIIITSSIEFPVIFLVGLIANKIGRRRTGILFTTIGILSCSAIVTSLLAMDENNMRNILVTGVAIFVRLNVYCIVSLMVVYCAELIPTPVRNLAFGLFNMATRATGMVASNLIPKDYNSLTICYGVLTVGQGLSIILIWSLDETKDRSLREDLIEPAKTKIGNLAHDAGDLESELHSDLQNKGQDVSMNYYNTSY